MYDSETAILILNYNGQKHLENFLPSVIQYSQGIPIYIIDNASTDDSLSFVKTEFGEKIKVIELNSNLGFAEGYNEGIKQLDLKYKYFVFLNSDVELTENWLTPLTHFLNANENVAGCQPKILSYKNKSMFEHAGACGGFVDKYYFPFCRGRIFESIEEDNLQHDYDTKVHWTSGACMIVKSELFFKVKGFDEDFFAHMEEIDLCLRISTIGYDFYCIPSSKVYHLGGGTLNYNSPKKTYLNFRNNLYLIIKNHQGPLLPKLFFRMSLDGLAACYFLMSFRPRHFVKIGHAHASMYLNFKKYYKKRIILKKERKKELRLFRGSILFDYYIKKTKFFNHLNMRRFKL